MRALGPMPRQTRWYQRGQDSQPTQDIMPVTRRHFLAGGSRKSHAWHMLLSIAIASMTVGWSRSATCCVAHSPDSCDAVSEDWDEPATAAIISAATSTPYFCRRLVVRPLYWPGSGCSSRRAVVYGRTVSLVHAAVLRCHEGCRQPAPHHLHRPQQRR